MTITTNGSAATADATFTGLVRDTSTALHAAGDADEPDRTRQAMLALGPLDRDAAAHLWGRVEDACRHLDTALAWMDDPYGGACWVGAGLASDQFWCVDGEYDPVAAAEYAVEYWEQQVHQTVLEAARTVADHTILAHT